MSDGSVGGALTDEGDEAAGETGMAVLPPWRVILSMIRYRPGLWSLDFIGVCFMRVSGQLAPAFVLKLFFDLLSGKAAAGFNVWTVVALSVATVVGRQVAMLGFTIADGRIYTHVLALLRRNLLEHILRRPGAKPLPDSPGEAVSRFRNDIMAVPDFVILFNDITIGGAIALVSVILMARTSLAITLFALIPVLLTGIISAVASRRIGDYRKASRRAAGKVSGFIGEFFGAVQAVKVAGAEPQVMGRFHELNDERARLALRESLFIFILHSLFDNSNAIATGVILLLASASMQAGSFTIGDLSFFVAILGATTDFTGMIGNLFARYKQLGISVKRMQRLMEDSRPEALVRHLPLHFGPVQPPMRPVARKPEDRLERLEAHGLSFGYPGSSNGVHGIDLDIRRGSLTVVTGRVGSGKTTLLRALLGLLPPDGGHVLWNGHLVTEPDAFFVPPRCAYTAQVPRLFSDSLRGNILLGLDLGDDLIMGAARLAVLDEDILKLEAGLDTKVGPRGVKLSGGQMQRAAAARMFARGPELLVFDDLSSALDVHTEAELWERVLSRPETTCLAVSHRRAALRRADQVIVMDQGALVARGRLEELLETSEEMRAIWQEGQRQEG